MTVVNTPAERVNGILIALKVAESKDSFFITKSSKYGLAKYIFSPSILIRTSYDAK
ncbi:hypothetical protein KIAC18_002381 [Sporomusa sphaeroides]|uniref:hypothetical protein n=1 Tax=Sporomusa sphaeroides TaxID=47679 RepID=UPI003DA17ED3